MARRGRSRFLTPLQLRERAAAMLRQASGPGVSPRTKRHLKRAAERALEEANAQERRAA